MQSRIAQARIIQIFPKYDKTVSKIRCSCRKPKIPAIDDAELVVDRPAKSRLGRVAWPRYSATFILCQMLVPGAPQPLDGVPMRAASAIEAASMLKARS